MLVAVLAAGAVVAPGSPVSADGCTPPPPPPPVTDPCSEIRAGGCGDVSPVHSFVRSDCPPSQHHPGPGPGSNDPATTPETVTTICSSACSVTLPLDEAQATVNAASGPPNAFQAASVRADDPVLFATRNGGDIKPNCPDYAETFSDWVQFGFRGAGDASGYHKIGTFRLNREMSRSDATITAERFQVCFAAPYRFTTRNGFRLGHQGRDFVGVLPECGSLHFPCVKARQVVRSRHGWVARIRFNVPASAQDPKALG
jgi:hypothetical protein